MRDDKETFRAMAGGFVVICICCAIMHHILVTHGHMYFERKKPRYNIEKKDTTGNMKEGVGTVTGLVSATSYDCFYLTLPDGKLQCMMLGDLKSPKVGTRVEVTYAGGDPPKALMVAKPKLEPAGNTSATNAPGN